MTNAWQSLLGSRKASSGSLPGWVAILFGLESVPSFHRPQPIPFDKDNAKLLQTEEGIVVRVRLDRDEVTGKSTVDDLPLLLNKRKARQARVVADRLLSGEYTWKGSNVIYSRGKWYLALCYEMPANSHLSLDPKRVLYVRPGKRSPWRVSVNRAESWPFGGNGLHVTHARKAVQAERNSRKAHYRWAGSNQKSHGRRRADAAWTKLASRWRDFTKRYNNEVSRQLIRLAVSRGCGRIVYITPNERVRESRFLSLAGNDRRSAMSWDYFQFGSMLAAKCESEGIEYGKIAKEKTKAVSGRLRGVRNNDAAKHRRGKKTTAGGLPTVSVS